MFKIGKWLAAGQRRKEQIRDHSLLSESHDFQPEGISSKLLDVSHCIDNHLSIAAISFHGVYLHGSKGREHASYIAARCCFLMVYRNSVAIVIDMKDLSYEWGSDILGALQTIDQFLQPKWEDMTGGKSIHIVASEKSVGLSSLFDQSAL